MLGGGFLRGVRGRKVLCDQYEKERSLDHCVRCGVQSSADDGGWNFDNLRGLLLKLIWIYLVDYFYQSH